MEIIMKKLFILFFLQSLASITIENLAISSDLLGGSLRRLAGVEISIQVVTLPEDQKKPLIGVLSLPISEVIREYITDKLKDNPSADLLSLLQSH